MNYLLPCCLRLCLFATSLIFHFGVVTVFAQPVTNQAVVVSLDFDLDAEQDASYEQYGVPSVNPNYYRCSYFLRSTSHLRFLRASPREVAFLENQSISLSSSAYINSAGENNVGLLGYDAEWVIPGYWDFYQYPVTVIQFYRDKTDLLIGFRFTRLEAGTQHHGWLRFTRPDTNFTTAFELVAYDWNPVPGQPIAAGQPPAIPLQLRVIPEGLQLEKPDGAVGWVLEATDRLGPEEDWRQVPNSQGPLILLPQHDARQFYRLRRP